MTRWLPHPWFALWLLVAWLLLQQSLAAPTIVLGIVLALALSWARRPQGRECNADSTANHLMFTGSFPWPTYNR